MSCAIAEPTRDERIAAVGFDYESQPKQYVSACNLCGANKWHAIYDRDRCGYAALTVACRSCGLVCMNPRMTRESYAEFYHGWYRAIVEAHSGQPCDPEAIARSQENYARMLAEFIADWIQPDYRTLIDVGGSCGVHAATFASRFGLKSTVLDPAPDELAKAAELGCETIAGFIEDYEPREKFDVVTLIQTADHLLDLQGSLRKLRRLMSLNGVLLVDIVNFAEMLKKFGILASVKIDHPYSLTHETFLACLQRVGLKIVKQGETECKRHIIYACQKTTPIEDAMPPDGYVADLFKRLGAKL